MRCRYITVNFLNMMNNLNSLWTSDAKWRPRSGSTLVQVMACCLTAPSHYLNQCWLIISEVLWHSPESNFTVEPISNYCVLMGLKITFLKCGPRGRWVNILTSVKSYRSRHPTPPRISSSYSRLKTMLQNTKTKIINKFYEHKYNWKLYL